MKYEDKVELCIKVSLVALIAVVASPDVFGLDGGAAEYGGDILKTQGSKIKTLVKPVLGIDDAVDRSIDPKSGKIVIAVVDGELTVKRLLLAGRGDNVFLMPENSKYTKITITEEMSFHIWGVVTYVIHKL